jgi:hypothetical protein
MNIRPTSLTQIDDVESFFSIMNCDKIVRRFVESIEVPKTVTRSVFPDRDRTEYRFTGKTSDVRNIYDRLYFNFVLPVEVDKRNYRDDNFDENVESVLNLYQDRWRTQKLMMLRGQYELVYVSIDESNPHIYRVSGRYYRLKSYADWFHRRFSSNNGW